MPDHNPGAAPAVIDQISRLLAVTVCQHCGKPPYHPVGAGNGPGLDHVDEVEARLWRQLNEAAKVRAAAPPEPSADEIETADKALAQTRSAEQTLLEQIDQAREVLDDPGAWLRPGRRMAIAGQLAEDRNALHPVRAQLAAEQKRVRELRLRRDRRRAYLHKYRRVLETGRRAREELDRRIDELIHGYASLPVPPPWFALGLGYPPRPGEYRDWLRRARAVIAYRRRYGVDDPLEPLGAHPPEEGTPQHAHWRAAQR